MRSWGQKRLKAVTVNGEGKVSLADPERFEHARQDVMRLFRASPVIFGELGIAEFGTPALVDLMRQRRMAPTENFRKTVFPASDNYSGPAIRRDFRAKNDGCYGCPIQVQEEHPTVGSISPNMRRVFQLLAGLNGISSLSCHRQGPISFCNDLGMGPITAEPRISAGGRSGGVFPRQIEVPALLPRRLPGAVAMASSWRSVSAPADRRAGSARFSP